MRNLLGLMVLVALSVHCKQRPSNESDASTAYSAQAANTAVLETKLVAIQNNLVNFDVKPLTPKARLGLNNILSGKAIPFPLPLAAYSLVVGKQNIAHQWLSEGTVPHPYQKDSTIVVGTGDALYTENGVELFSKTCFQCHSGTVAGMSVGGLGNAHFDAIPIMGVLKSTLDRFWIAQGANLLRRHLDPLGFSDEWFQASYTYLTDFKSYAEEFFMPPFVKHAVSRGDNLGPYSVWVMSAKFENPLRYGTVAGKGADPKLVKLATETPLPNVDPLPWWLMKYEERAYWFWDAPWHSPAAFSLNFYTPKAAIDNINNMSAHKKRYEEKVDLIDEVLQYARETEPPALPPNEQSELLKNWEGVQRGDALFHGGSNSTGKDLYCATCHGTYKFQGDQIIVTYPNRGLDDVKSDPEYNRVLQKFKPLAMNANRARLYYGEKYGPLAYVVDKEGYTSPVLVGVWATAPYMHNGSVPTLADLLEPSQNRPIIWGRLIYQPTAYDFIKVGMPYDRIVTTDYQNKVKAAQGQALDSASAVESRRFYNGYMFGRSPMGHEYGVNLTPQEKADLVLFMKALAPLPGKVSKIVSSKAQKSWATGAYDVGDPNLPRSDYQKNQPAVEY